MIVNLLLNYKASQFFFNLSTCFCSEKLRAPLYHTFIETLTNYKRKKPTKKISPLINSNSIATFRLQNRDNTVEFSSHTTRTKRNQFIPPLWPVTIQRHHTFHILCRRSLTHQTQMLRI